ncbi:probable transcription factor At3g04930 [Humulus lupulus]|uniref:probable transcription factor At3g04930 n=1 Tax=Humulus lupulus TaxID=3486 RepID=UPI002B4143F4|nr:probable transcription factor At3g04930 [Humulus lupulus]
MTWPLVSWLLSSSSSSSTSSSEYDNDDIFDEPENDHKSPNGDDHDTNDVEDDDYDGVDSVSVAVTGGADPSFSTSKRRRTDDDDDYYPNAAAAKKVLQKRVWSEEDEIELLQSFLDYTVTQKLGPHRRTANSFYNDRVKPELRGRFNQNQLADKLRRLRRKFQNTWSKMKNSGVDFRFRNPHDRGIFEISQKIWSGRGGAGGCGGHSSSTDLMLTQQDYEILLDENNSAEKWIMGLGLKTTSFGGGGEEETKMGDEKWREEKIRDLEVYSKRLESIQTQVKAALDKLRKGPAIDEAAADV